MVDSVTAVCLGPTCVSVRPELHRRDLSDIDHHHSNACTNVQHNPIRQSVIRNNCNLTHIRSSDYLLTDVAYFSNNHICTNDADHYLLTDVAYFSNNHNICTDTDYDRQHYQTYVQKYTFVFVPGRSQNVEWTKPTTDSFHDNVDQRLQKTQPFGTRGNRVYTGPVDALHLLDNAFEIDVIGDVRTESLDDIKATILAVWGEQYSECECTFDISLILRENYVGDYGTHLTRLYYFLTKDGEEIPPARISAPVEIADRFVSDELPNLVYRGNDPTPFDLHYTALLNKRVKMVTDSKYKIKKAPCTTLHGHPHPPLPHTLFNYCCPYYYFFSYYYYCYFCYCYYHYRCYYYNYCHYYCCCYYYYYYYCYYYHHHCYYYHHHCFYYFFYNYYYYFYYYYCFFYYY
nr:hypothetical protein BaRGS_034170 [Batillaria attramentaria]